jgi:hypothetical protein
MVTANSASTRALADGGVDRDALIGQLREVTR